MFFAALCCAGGLAIVKKLRLCISTANESQFSSILADPTSSMTCRMRPLNPKPAIYVYAVCIHDSPIIPYRREAQTLLPEKQLTSSMTKTIKVGRLRRFAA